MGIVPIRSSVIWTVPGRIAFYLNAGPRSGVSWIALSNVMKCVALLKPLLRLALFSATCLLGASCTTEEGIIAGAIAGAAIGGLVGHSQEHHSGHGYYHGYGGNYYRPVYHAPRRSVYRQAAYVDPYCY